MIVKLIEDCTVRGQLIKKGSKIVLSRSRAFELCREGKAVAGEDVPCAERQKRAAVKKTKKKKAASAAVKISNKL